MTVITEDARQRQTRSECPKNVPIGRKHTNRHTLANASPILGGLPCSWPAGHPFPPRRMTLLRRSCRGHNLRKVWGHSSEGSCRVACFVALPVTPSDFSPTCWRRRDRTGRNFTLCRRHLLGGSKEPGGTVLKAKKEGQLPCR